MIKIPTQIIYILIIICSLTNSLFYLLSLMYVKEKDGSLIFLTIVYFVSLMFLLVSSLGYCELRDRKNKLPEVEKKNPIKA